MRDITSDMMGYLEAKRHLWNVHFREKVGTDFGCGGGLDEYENIDKLLFLGLVLRDLGVTSVPNCSVFGGDPIKEVIVRPARISPELPIMLKKKAEGPNCYWEKTITISSAGLELEFIEFFEWDKYAFASYPMVAGKIVKSKDYKEFIGRTALVETSFVCFVTRSKK